MVKYAMYSFFILGTGMFIQVLNYQLLDSNMLTYQVLKVFLCIGVVSGCISVLCFLKSISEYFQTFK